MAYISNKNYFGPCDVGFLAKTDTSTPRVDVDFELLILDV